MHSGQVIESVDALKAFSSQLQAFQRVLAGIIQDSKPNSDGEYKNIIIPDRPIQSVARGLWNSLVRLEKFRKKMNDSFYPTKIKAGLLINGMMNMVREFEAAHKRDDLVLASDEDLMPLLLGAKA